MALDLTILYRGSLSSCNYDCHYCPFAKRHETASELRVDRQQLERFLRWVNSRGDDRLALFFTPWGEAMTRRWYRDTIAQLSHMPHIAKVAVQTNLSFNTDWVKECDPSRLGLWCTWHPQQVSRDRFVAQCRRLDHHQIRYSVGIVGLHEHYDQALRLRAEIDSDVYMWVNAFKDVQNYYSEDEVRRWCGIDPLFRVNARTYASRGRACRSGESVISVDGNGTIRRCHFIRTPIGNLYQPGFEQALRPRQCSNATCSCHIGYVHMPELELDSVFADGLLERIPVDLSSPWSLPKLSDSV